MIMKCFVCARKKTLFPSSRTTTSKSKPELQAPPVLEKLGSVQIFSFKELSEATQGFRSSNKIGEGGFGSVYKGGLRDGTLVAVKILSAESKQGDSEFIAEIRAMSNVRHENLIKLIGGCIDENNRILVYDFMENNSLAPWLGGEQNRIQLGWKRRRDICLGIAKGLAYLHEEVKPHIVHRDIKASNILLDQNFTPKVSDFGLAKLFPDNITHISTRVAGTLGYLAPEYAISGHLSRKSDVYSFGVLILEILSGRCAVAFDLELGEYYLVEKAWNMYKAGDLLHIMDPSLEGDFPEAEAILFLKVGLLCVQETPSLRPKMSKAMKLMMSDGSLDINETEITQPVIIPDLKQLKLANTNRQSTGSPSSSKYSSSRTSAQSPLSRFWKSSQQSSPPQSVHLNKHSSY